MIPGMFRKIAVEVLGPKQETSDNDMLALLELLLAKPDGLTVSQILDVFDVDEIHLAKTLLALEYANLVSRMPDVKYVITRRGMEKVMVDTVSKDKSHTERLSGNEIKMNGENDH